MCDQGGSGGIKMTKRCILSSRSAPGGDETRESTLIAKGKEHSRMERKKAFRTVERHEAV
jgi:hypothetical protein